MANGVNYFRDDNAILVRSGELPYADFVTGVNNAASNAAGIGINVGGGAITGEPQQFTLEDQRGVARTTQISQLVGGNGLGDGTSGTLPDAVIFKGTPTTNGNGNISYDGNVSLTDLATGWVTV